MLDKGSIVERTRFWAIATLAWHGSFRIHELLSRTASEYDQTETLLWKDLKTGKVNIDGKELRVITVHVDSPKLDRIGAGDKIQILETGTIMCPIKALYKYRTATNITEKDDLPVFRITATKCYTGRDMNKKLTELTGSVTKHFKGAVVRTHSFRAGLPSEMAKAGHPEGNWEMGACVYICVFIYGYIYK